MVKPFRDATPGYILHILKATLYQIHNWSPCYILSKIRSILYEVRYPDHPWLTQQANSILSTLLKPTDVGLELGSGKSTLWFARCIRHLTSVEHDEWWYKWVSGKLKADNISNVSYIFCEVREGEKAQESSYVQVVNNNLSKDSLDFVLVDCPYHRDVCANMVLEKIRPGGFL